MTIKKPANAGGATIADRFRLDAPAEKAKKPAAVGGTAMTVALSAAVVALAIVGFLTFTLYKHWEYLMPI